jgi:hypothetical protein
LGLLPGALTPPLQAHLSRLGARLSFAEAASELWHLKGVRVAPSTARRRTEADGAVYATLQAAAAARVLATAPPPLAGPALQQVSVDGAMVPLVDGGWREVRSLAIGTVVPGRQPGMVRCAELSYFSRMTDAATFTTLAAGEVHRRGVETAGLVAGVVDGAPWCQEFLDRHRPEAVRILDFPHAAQRLSDVAEAVWGTGPIAQTWAAAQRAELRDGDPAAVLAAIQTLLLGEARDEAGAGRVQADVLGYLTPRLAQMQYACFRAQGLPIGSGIVESANKLVVEARLKGAGRRWAAASVNPMVALRGALCSDRWEESWVAIAHLRGQRRRSPPAAHPTPARPAASAASVAVPARRAAHPAIAEIPRAGPKTIVGGRPTAQHPWKR